MSGKQRVSAGNNDVGPNSDALITYPRTGKGTDNKNRRSKWLMRAYVADHSDMVLA